MAALFAEPLIDFEGPQPAAKIKKAALRSQRGDHAAATCRMGESPATSIVDADLKVHGVNNLWICSNAVGG